MWINAKQYLKEGEKKKKKRGKKKRTRKKGGEKKDLLHFDWCKKRTSIDDEKELPPSSCEHEQRDTVDILACPLCDSTDRTDDELNTVQRKREQTMINLTDQIKTS